MARLLEASGQGARRLELALWKVDGDVLLRCLEMAAASRDAAHVARLFAGKLDDIDAGFGIELARLSAPWCEPLALAQRDLDAAAERHGTSLAACIDRLAARLGEGAVRRPVLRASHLPERAQGWMGVLVPEVAGQESLAFHARPLKLLDRAEPIAVIHASPKACHAASAGGGSYTKSPAPKGRNASPRMVARTLHRAAARLLPGRG